MDEAERNKLGYIEKVLAAGRPSRKTTANPSKIWSVMRCIQEMVIVKTGMLARSTGIQHSV
jgi:hypothetical protein